MNRRYFLSISIVIILALALFLGYRAWGGYFIDGCPSDEAVSEWFQANKKVLEDLLNMASADDEKVTHVGRGVVELRPGTSLPEARKQEYLRKVRETGTYSFTYTRNEGVTVSLWTDAPSTIAAITGSYRYKDVAYIQDINKGRYRELLRSSLDGLEKSNEDTYWLRHIEGNWYIEYIKH
jgi:hypothetical protein